MWSGISLLFWLTLFFGWQIILSIFCVYSLAICVSSLVKCLSMFSLNCLFCCCWVVRFLHIFWMLNPYETLSMFSKYFLPFCWLSFHFLGNILWWQKFYILMKSSSSGFCCLCFGCHIQESIIITQGPDDLPLRFLLSFMLFN